jgi:hypothetical protein
MTTKMTIERVQPKTKQNIRRAVGMSKTVGTILNRIIYNSLHRRWEINERPARRHGGNHLKGPVDRRATVQDAQNLTSLAMHVEIEGEVEKVIKRQLRHL